MGRSRFFQVLLGLFLVGSHETVSLGGQQECGAAFARIRRAAQAIEARTTDVVDRFRWIRRATGRIYDAELKSRVETLLRTPVENLNETDVTFLKNVVAQMGENPFLRDHPHLKAAQNHLEVRAKLDAFLMAPLQSFPHENRAAKGWDRLSQTAQRAGALALARIRSEPQKGEHKVSFPNRILFQKFFDMGVTYIIAYEVRDKAVFIHGLGPHENFYDKLSDLRK